MTTQPDSKDEHTASFDDDGKAPFDVLMVTAPRGSFVEIGKRVANDGIWVTAKFQRPGFGAIHAAPLKLGLNMTYQTAVSLVLAELAGKF